MRCDERYIFSSVLMPLNQNSGFNSLKYNNVPKLLSETIFH